MKKINYTKNQLSKLKDLNYINLQLFDYSGNKTNFMQLTDELLDELSILLDLYECTKRLQVINSNPADKKLLIQELKKDFSASIIKDAKKRMKNEK